MAVAEAEAEAAEAAELAVAAAAAVLYFPVRLLVSNLTESNAIINEGSSTQSRPSDRPNKL